MFEAISKITQAFPANIAYTPPMIPAQANHQAELERIRAAHGWDREGEKASAWSKRYILEQAEELAAAEGEDISTCKARLKQQARDKFAFLDDVLKGGVPTLNNVSLTLADLLLVPPELVDGYDIWSLAQTHQSVDSGTLVKRVEATGVGFGGMEGVSWLPALSPEPLPAALRDRLQRLGQAIFLFYDALAELHDEEEEVRGLLGHKRPDSIPALTTGRLDYARLDVVIVREADGELGLRVTEVESAPGVNGTVAAMEHGYGRDGIVSGFARHLRGKRFTICLTSDWSEYLFEQALFCKLLSSQGVPSRVVLDRPLADVAAWADKHWARYSEDLPWNTDVIGRLEAYGLLDYVEGTDGFAGLDFSDRDAVVRMGYFDNLSTGFLRSLSQHRVINGNHYYLENKAAMAALSLPSVRRWLAERDEEALSLPSVRRWLAERDEEALSLLDQGFGATRLLTPDNMEAIAEAQPHSVLKIAAWDHGNLSWGARGLVFGAEVKPDVWRRTIEEWCALPHPVVAQTVAESVQFAVPYRDHDGSHKIMQGARARWSPFLLRNEQGEVEVAGSSLTLRTRMKVHGSTDAIQTIIGWE